MAQHRGSVLGRCQTLLHFSSQCEPFASRKPPNVSHETCSRSLIPKVEECKALAVGEDPDTQYKQPSQKLFDTRIWEQAGTSQ
jgi:hypothetical protein